MNPKFSLMLFPRLKSIIIHVMTFISLVSNFLFMANDEKHLGKEFLIHFDEVAAFLASSPFLSDSSSSYFFVGLFFSLYSLAIH